MWRLRFTVQNFWGIRYQKVQRPDSETYGLVRLLDHFKIWGSCTTSLPSSVLKRSHKYHEGWHEHDIEGLKELYMGRLHAYSYFCPTFLVYLCPVSALHGFSCVFYYCQLLSLKSEAFRRGPSKIFLGAASRFPIPSFANFFSPLFVSIKSMVINASTGLLLWLFVITVMYDLQGIWSTFMLLNLSFCSLLFGSFDHIGSSSMSHTPFWHSVEEEAAFPLSWWRG